MSMTVKKVLKILRGYYKEEDYDIYYSLGYLIPTTIASWRGSYDEPALGYGEGLKSTIKISRLIEELENATNGIFSYEGWKGGTYKFNKDQILHIDNPGCYSCTEIESIKLINHCLVINTYTEE